MLNSVEEMTVLTEATVSDSPSRRLPLFSALPRSKYDPSNRLACLSCHKAVAVMQDAMNSAAL